MKRTRIILYITLLIFCSSILAKEKLQQKLPIYAIIKPGKISTQIALGNGIVHKLHKQLGEYARAGSLLIEVIEKEGIRQYNNTINGRIAKLHVTIGAATTTGMPLVTVLDPKIKLLETSLSPDEAQKVKLGDKVYKQNSTKPVAIVERISPLVDPDKGAVTCYLRPIAKIKERIGEIVNLEIVIDSDIMCDKVVEVSELGSFTSNWKVEYISGPRVCLTEQK